MAHHSARRDRPLDRASGLVQREAYDYLTGRILDAWAQGGFDAAMLDLHGAMVTEFSDDGEGETLAEVARGHAYDRAIGAGDEWRAAIEDQLGQADLVLLLISDAGQVAIQEQDAGPGAPPLQSVDQPARGVQRPGVRFHVCADATSAGRS